jgi:hypothetical protein
VAEIIADKFGVDVRLVDWPEMSLKLESDDTVFGDEKLRGFLEVSYQQSLVNWLGSVRIA